MGQFGPSSPSVAHHNIQSCSSGIRKQVFAPFLFPFRPAQFHFLEIQMGFSFFVPPYSVPREGRIQQAASLCPQGEGPAGAQSDPVLLYCFSFEELVQNQSQHLSEVDNRDVSVSTCSNPNFTWQCKHSVIHKPWIEDLQGCRMYLWGKRNYLERKSFSCSALLYPSHMASNPRQTAEAVPGQSHARAECTTGNMSRYLQTWSLLLLTQHQQLLHSHLIEKPLGFVELWLPRDKRCPWSIGWEWSTVREVLIYP